MVFSLHFEHIPFFSLANLTHKLQEQASSAGQNLHRKPNSEVHLLAIVVLLQLRQY